VLRKSHAGWLLSRPHGFAGALVIIPGTYMKAGRQASQHNTGLLCPQELACPRLCSFDRRPDRPARKTKQVCAAATDAVQGARFVASGTHVSGEAHHPEPPVFGCRRVGVICSCAASFATGTPLNFVR